ncbi:MAG: lactate dehydrogenase [Proteobacteria bacterium]|nr:lactate dehydrogenase [Pseudomonadota bacterium]
MLNILISNIGFGEAAPDALKSLQKNAQLTENKEKKRFSEEDFIEKIKDSHILIAGTEKITKSVLEQAPHLKLIARVGVGVDNIDLEEAKKNAVSITYTPDAPSESVPEFTLALILNLIKGISISDHKLHEKIWYRPMGRMLSSFKFGIVGAGKIGSKVIQMIKAISPLSDIFFYDPYVTHISNATKCSLERLFRESDVVSLHLPLNASTKSLVDLNLLKTMKQGSYLVNTSRGGIIDENALYQILQTKHLAGAALDVFEIEPYNGNLTELENCLLTSHLGSMTHEVRKLMENQVSEDVLNFIQGRPLRRPLNGFNFVGLK